MKLISCLLADLIISSVSFAQTVSLRGQVTDQNGAVIPKAKVTLKKNSLFQNQRHLTRGAKLLLVFCLHAMAPLFTWGQDTTTTATLTGYIRDVTGATVPGAQVTLRNLATNQTRRAPSETDGSYRIAALPVGDYEARVEAQGFKTYVNPIVTLVLGQTAALDITLQAGEVSGEVTVTERPPALDPSSDRKSTRLNSSH